MGNNLERIVSVSIDIASPIVDSSSFDNLLIFGPEPAKKGHTAPPVGVYSGLSEVTGAGYVAVGENADIVGVAARIAFSQAPPPSHIYIGTLGAEEDISEKLDGLLAVDGWYAICPVGLTQDQVQAVIQWTEAQKKICAFAAFGPADSSETLYYRSFGIYCKRNSTQADEDVPLENQCIGVAWAAKCLNYHAGKETWAHKVLAGITPSELTSTEIAALEGSNISYFITTASRNITYLGKTLAGEWIDVIRFRDWLENDMQVRVANLFITNPKIPYTDKGIGLVENQMIASLKSGVYYEGIAPDEYDEDGKLIPGFVTHVPLSAELTSTQKASRKLTDCTFAARLAGAIHAVEIKGSLTYTL